MNAMVLSNHEIITSFHVPETLEKVSLELNFAPNQRIVHWYMGYSTFV